jgi:F0F1-type ATP synthase membrane subunit b/b'
MARFRQFNNINNNSNSASNEANNSASELISQNVEVSQQEFDGIRQEAEQFSSQRQESDALEVILSTSRCT